MASSTSKDVAIFRMTSATDTEANLSNDSSVGMDYGMTDQSVLGVVTYDWKFPSRRTDVPAPANKGITNPDVGLTAPTLTVGILVSEKLGPPGNRQVGLLSLWALQDKEIRGVFSKARLGIRNNKKPWCNFVPTNTAGWKIVDSSFGDDIIYGGKHDITLTFEFGGDSTQLAAQIQASLNSGKY